jgi:nucleoside-diphosphate-sugar epimerase
MRIAITGGSGRIGRVVTDMAIKQGHTIVSIDRVAPAPDVERPDVTYRQAELTNYADFERVLDECDALIHLAAIPTPGRNPDHEVHNNNVVSSYNALRAAVERGINRVCQASSINAIGAAYSRMPHYDYFPLDEAHPTYNEDPYSLSKWICEQQADSFARGYDAMTIASLRFHGVVPDPATMMQLVGRLGITHAKHLWGYTRASAAARACILSLTADFHGHEAFFIVAPETTVDEPSLDLARQFFPDVPLRGEISGRQGFFSCAKAARLLGWFHDETGNHSTISQ